MIEPNGEAWQTAAPNGEQNSAEVRKMLLSKGPQMRKATGDKKADLAQLWLFLQLRNASLQPLHLLPKGRRKILGSSLDNVDKLQRVVEVSGSIVSRPCGLACLVLSCNCAPYS